MIFQSVMACALAYLLVFVLHPLAAYAMKQGALPTDFRRLWRGLARSAAVTVLCLLPAAAWRLWGPSSGVGLSTLLEVAGAATATGVGWLAALLLLRHPIAEDPVFRRLLQRIPLLERV